VNQFVKDHSFQFHSFQFVKDHMLRIRLSTLTERAVCEQRCYVPKCEILCPCRNLGRRNSQLLRRSRRLSGICSICVTTCTPFGNGRATNAGGDGTRLAELCRVGAGYLVPQRSKLGEEVLPQKRRLPSACRKCGTVARSNRNEVGSAKGLK
jgi:hypothetical protein